MEKSAASDACFPSWGERWKERKKNCDFTTYVKVIKCFLGEFTFPTIPMPTLAACIMLTSFPPSPAVEGGEEGRKGGEGGREEREEGRRGRKGGEGVNSLGRRTVKGGESHQSKEVKGLGKNEVKWEGSTYRWHRLVSWCVF